MEPQVCAGLCWPLSQLQAAGWLWKKFWSLEGQFGLQDRIVSVQGCLSLVETLLESRVTLGLGQ